MITRLKLSTIEQGLPKYRSMLAGNAAYNPSSFESIASQTLTSDSTTVTFSSIPATYQHLQVRILARGTDTAGNRATYLRLNSDTSTNYSRHLLFCDGASVYAQGSASQTRIEIGNIPDAGSTASQFGVSIVDIHDYASTTKNKTVRCFSGQDQNGSGQVLLTSGAWFSTSAVTSLTFSVSTLDFVSGSTFALYGIRGA